ncbi:MAG TPA: aldehyde dehydrogenase [Hypericibacter adhaerens]|jgi:acyl-CoA reductase-like NAD-dependent aldehyde dehydrogenase|uniref:Betaine-aldehyde dehydrogenase n=1 Tax=Hypericibacter adhaerens TaxID=2602016 RepID=A0A5J6N3L4_9PROT|nr:aldehyde dehydrogenase [Hypericibacter adhaerens]QEX24612.1 betaine-aldehyde dehydrogenase [Hypericibacter adhaerens]HWA45823.1 aldehyde dehydrogenase [Hypericibacter adhaerens]
MNEIVNYSMFIDGRWTEAADGKRLGSVNPATGEDWASFPEAGIRDVDAAVRAAHKAMTEGPWSRMTASERGKRLRRLADLLAAQADDVAKLETTDTGKLIRETRSQTRYTAEYLNYFAGAADKLEGATLPIDKPDLFVMTIREPIGVVAAIVPWNSQLMLTAVKLGPALATGNAIVIKASEHGPVPLLELARLCAEADIPPGVVNVVTGLGDPCGKALTTHPLVARIAFTGGPSTARHIIRNSAENFGVVTLELGGKSPILVFDDADLDSAVNGILAGNFGATGQSCVAGTRVFIQASVYDEVLGRVAERAKRIRIGNPMEEQTEMGPLATKGQRDNIERVVAASLKEGASLVTGGSRPAAQPKGWYFEPTILACETAAVPVARQELFGPVLSAFRFKDEADAIAAANDTEFGLAAGIFSRDGGRALRVMRQLRTGIVWINSYRASSPIAPFGGYKSSGTGREAGRESLLDYTRTKTVWIDTSTKPMGDPFIMR